MLSTAINNSAATSSSAACKRREPMAGALTDTTGYLGMVQCACAWQRRGKGEAKQDERAHEAGPPATMQSTRIASAHRATCRRCGCVASLCVATQRHSLSRLTEPLWVASAPQVHAALSTAPVLFGILRRERARLKQTFWLRGEYTEM